ncbi:hypothetical protein LAZ40_05595 [Cereibacter sphaeroides]|uniref:hypothetical protein n=1 Tax=Cereibacter sphaeroides TaxID=1063 RepID=UPI001F3F630B|nr:hypothetical protein [Cereibacter sphaeroides]MCE6958523.1 hypothetical protein [Cereibacter sphaeroides]MCE6972815.1 hypothetical protein [Cereibacter sphaeroides]
MHPLLDLTGHPGTDPAHSGGASLILAATDGPVIKKALAAAFPDMGPSLRLEIFARASGWRTAAALQSALAGAPSVATSAPDGEALHRFHDLVLREHQDGHLDANGARLAVSVRQHVGGWLASHRLKIPQPEGGPALVARAEGWDDLAHGSLIARYVIREKQLGWFVSLPGMIGTRFSDETDMSSLRRVEHVQAAIALGIALDGLVPARDIPLLDLGSLMEGHYEAHDGGVTRSRTARRAARRNGRSRGHASDAGTLQLPGSVFTGRTSKLLEGIAGSLVSDVMEDQDFLDLLTRCHPDWTSRADQETAVFRSSRLDGPAVGIEPYRVASVVLAVLLQGMPFEIAGERLSVPPRSIPDMLPEGNWDRRKDWNDNLRNLSALMAERESTLRRQYGSIVMDRWRVAPLLDDWIELAEGGARHNAERAAASPSP